MSTVVNLEALTMDPHSMFHDVRLNGVLFTGVGVRGRTSWRFENGVGHGHCMTFSDEGQLLEAFTLEHGSYVGESKSWFADGTLRRHVKHDAPRSEVHFIRSGQLVESFDEATDTRRRWYDDGVLRYERVGSVTKYFARSGNVAFVDDTMMLEELESIANEWSLERQLFTWLDQLLGRKRAVGVQVLRRLLAHSNLFVVSTAIAFAANSNVFEVREDLEKFIDDERIPPPQTEDGRGRSATRSLGEDAKQALHKLTRISQR